MITFPVISVAPSIHNNLRLHIESVAEKNKITFQRLASSRWTGTDTDAFAYTGNGIASCLISLPLRYMHTTVEMVSKDDIENTIRLLYEAVCSIKAGQSFNYHE